jgi:hypothetical protein
VPWVWKSRNQSWMYISVARAPEMSPRSMIVSAGQPKLSSSSTTWAFAPRVVAGDEERMLARDPPRLDHRGGGDRVEGLDDLGIGIGALDLLADAVVVANREPQLPVAEVERVRDVDQHLAVQVVGARGLEHGEGIAASRRVDQQLAVGGGFGEGTLVLALGARPDHDVVAELAQLPCQCLPDDACSKDSDAHLSTLRSPHA